MVSAQASRLRGARRSRATHAKNQSARHTHAVAKEPSPARPNGRAKAALLHSLDDRSRLALQLHRWSRHKQAGCEERDEVARPMRKTRALVTPMQWQRNLRPRAQTGGRRLRSSTPLTTALGSLCNCIDGLGTSKQVARSATKSRDPCEKPERSSRPCSGKGTFARAPKRAGEGCAPPLP